MCSLFWGCIVSSVWSSSNVASSASSSSSVSQAQYEHHFHGSKHHSVPISIYRSPVSLRGGHGGFPLLFLSNLFAEQLEQQRGSRDDGCVSGGGGSSQALVFLPLAPLPINPPLLPCPLPERSLGLRTRRFQSQLPRPVWSSRTEGGGRRGRGGLGSLRVRRQRRAARDGGRASAPVPLGFCDGESLTPWLVAADMVIAAAHLPCLPPSFSRSPSCGRASRRLGELPPPLLPSLHVRSLPG